MCTLSWSRSTEGDLEVYFNRDEQKTRPLAEPPRIHTIGGVRFLSPIDPAGGGTWMLANEHGLVVCLLNRWHEVAREGLSYRSRGKLVMQMAAAASVEEVSKSLPDPRDYRPYTLVVFSPEGDRCFEWDGRDSSEADVPPFLTSSSFRFEEVRDHRRSCFEELGPGLALHRAHGETPSARTIRMNRPDAQTWSRSFVKIGEEIVWQYLAEQADLSGPSVATIATLERRQPAESQ